MMMMSKEEIGNSYRRAVNQNAQIGILAELNAISKEEVIEILEEQGYAVKKRGRKKKDENVESRINTECGTDNAAVGEEKKDMVPDFVIKVLEDEVEREECSIREMIEELELKKHNIGILREYLKGVNRYNEGSI